MIRYSGTLPPLLGIGLKCRHSTRGSLRAQRCADVALLCWDSRGVRRRPRVETTRREEHVTTPLLEGVRVVDLAGEPAAIAGRVLADLGADVVLVEPPGGVSLRLRPHVFAAWAAGKRSVVVDGSEDARLDGLLAGADIVIDTPGFPGAWTLDPRRARGAVWVSVTPFGHSGPRAQWRASDLGIMAASGNMWATGDPDRAPIRCTYPSGYAHGGGEIAFAALSALWAGGPRRVDVSLQEAVFSANMVSIALFAETGNRFQRTGARIGRTREIWRTRDGYVSYGVRPGAARVKNYAFLQKFLGEEGIPGAEVFGEIDWTTYNPANASDEELEAIQRPLGQWFSRHTCQELYDLACQHNLFLAPTLSPREMFVNEQLDARDFFASLGGYRRFPHRFVVASSVDGEAAQPDATRPAPALGSSSPTWPALARAVSPRAPGGPGAWSGLKVLEF